MGAVGFIGKMAATRFAARPTGCASGGTAMTARAARKPKLDEIGYWSEVKLDIIREYAKAYSTNLSAQARPALYHAYIDAFAGAGVHVSKTTGDEVEGSPLIALNTQPPFREYHFID